MVGLWYPEPPLEPDNLGNNSTDYFMMVTTSDEESEEALEGYQPLSDLDDISGTSSDSEREMVSEASTLELEGPEKTKSNEEGSKLSVNEKQVHQLINLDSERRTDEQPGTSAASSSAALLSNSQNNQSWLQMGEQQVADILAAMASVTLPSSSFPAWANVVPEEHWKQQIMDRIKHLQNKTPS